MQIGRLELARPVFCSEVTHDRIRFPQHEAVVFFQRRHETVWVLGEIIRFVVLSERAADIDALMGQPKLTDRPHHLLHVDGCVSPPDLDHAVSSPWPAVKTYGCLSVAKTT